MAGLTLTSKPSVKQEHDAALIGKRCHKENLFNDISCFGLRTAIDFYDTYNIQFMCTLSAAVSVSKTKIGSDKVETL